MKRNNNTTRIEHLGSLYSTVKKRKLKRNIEAITELKQSYKVHTGGKGIKGTVSKYIIKEGEEQVTMVIHVNVD
jgi:preprotein translocase subunit YajC